MEKTELIQFFAEFWRIDPSKVNDNLRLDDKNLTDHSSMRIYQFFAKVESKFKVKIRNLSKILTFGDLFTNLG